MDYEKIFNEINTNILPHIKEGISITKDYAFDLMDRTILYLLIHDILTIIFDLITITILYKIFIYIYNYYKKAWFTDNLGDLKIWVVISCFILSSTILFTIVGLYTGITNIVKTLTIPEIRIYQELQQVNKNFNI